MVAIRLRPAPGASEKQPARGRTLDDHQGGLTPSPQRLCRLGEAPRQPKRVRPHPEIAEAALFSAMGAKQDGAHPLGGRAAGRQPRRRATRQVGHVPGGSRGRRRASPTGRTGSQTRGREAPERLHRKKWRQSPWIWVRRSHKEAPMARCGPPKATKTRSSRHHGIQVFDCVFNGAPQNGRDGSGRRRPQRACAARTFLQAAAFALAAARHQQHQHHSGCQPENGLKHHVTHGRPSFLIELSSSSGTGT